MTSVLIMAGGTGGHVYPGLAVARVLHHRGVDVVWMGTRQGLEARVVPSEGFHMEWISIQGLRGRGISRWLLLPLHLLIAMGQALKVFLRRRPSVVLSMGGFVAGPGGLIAWLLRKPLVIHEANAVAGWTNRWLALFAQRVLCGFPESFGNRPGTRHVGNPVRAEIAQLPKPEDRLNRHEGPIRVLVLGGSQGARKLNMTVAKACESMPVSERPALWHQCGRDWLEETQAAYATMTDSVKLVAFIEDMASAYAWADVVLCRAGAMTIAELTAAGIGAILVPFPHATDDHQTANARYLTEHDAAILLPETECTPQRLQTIFHDLAGNRNTLTQMAVSARACSTPGADEAVARICQDLAHA